MKVYLITRAQMEDLHRRIKLTFCDHAVNHSEEEDVERLPGGQVKPDTC